MAACIDQPNLMAFCLRCRAEIDILEVRKHYFSKVQYSLEHDIRVMGDWQLSTVDWDTGD